MAIVGPSPISQVMEVTGGIDKDGNPIIGQRKGTRVGQTLIKGTMTE